MSTETRARRCNQCMYCAKPTIGDGKVSLMAHCLVSGKADGPAKTCGSEREIKLIPAIFTGRCGPTGRKWVLA